MKKSDESLLNLIDALLQAKGGRSSFIDMEVLWSATFGIGWSSDMLTGALKTLSQEGHIALEGQRLERMREAPPIKVGM